MTRIVDYYFVPQSPWSYLGHRRFAALAAAHGASIAVKPVDIGRVFSVSGGQPLAQRPVQRQSYRLLELDRHARKLDVPLVAQPKHFPVSGVPSSLAIVAATASAPGAAMDLAFAFMRAVWVEERDIADAATIDAVVASCGLDAVALRASAATTAVRERFEANTNEAIAAEVFGAPTYVPRFGPAREQRFWGQDRLDLLADALGA
jgi:2-hydroxychromene-2-carboxylate isomerase